VYCIKAFIDISMDLAHFQELEKRVGFQLPKHYKDFLLNYPQELKDLRLADYYFFADDVEWLAEIILAIPSHIFFPIGMDFGGNYFYLKRNGEDTCVYYFDHEEVEDEYATLDTILQPKYANLEEFKEFLIDVWGELLKYTLA
jgi:hypothetical protein